MSGDTKQLITEQLLKILERKSIEDVTVKSLVDACHISRQTFYYHFQDIIDVLEWKVRTTVEQGLEESLKSQDFQDVIRIFVNRIVINKFVITRLLRSERRAECEWIFMEGIRTYLRELFHRIWPNPGVSPADINAFLDFHSYGLVGMILRQCDQGETDEEVLVDQISRILSGKMKEQFSQF